MWNPKIPPHTHISLSILTEPTGKNRGTLDRKEEVMEPAGSAFKLYSPGPGPSC